MKKKIEELQPRDCFIWEDERYMILSLGEMFKSEVDMIYTVKLDGEDKGLIFDFPKGLSINQIFFILLINDIEDKLIKENAELNQSLEIIKKFL